MEVFTEKVKVGSVVTFRKDEQLFFGLITGFKEGMNRAVVQMVDSDDRCTMDLIIPEQVETFFPITVRGNSDRWDFVKKTWG